MTERWPDNPELVEVYDVENAGRWDVDFSLELASELGVGRVTEVPMESLSHADLDRFVAEGFVRLDQAFSTDQAAAAVTALLDQAGIDPAADSWPGPVHRIPGTMAPAVVATINTPRLVRAIDQLLGPGRWQRRDTGFGTFPIRFPSETDPGDAGWHIDGSFGDPPDYEVNFASQGRALLLLMLFTDVGKHDAPTRIRVGSHLPVARALERIDGDVAFDPYAHAPETLELPIVDATGRAGTVYLCHPFLVHAATWPHRGRGPRVLAQPAISHPEGEGLGRFDYRNEPDTPVVRAVLQALDGAA